MVMAWCKSLLALALFMVLCVPALSDDSTWYSAHATFYGDMQGADTMRK